MSGMTKTQLTEHIKDVVAPLVKDAMGGPELADLVRENVNTALEAQPESGPSKHLFEEPKQETKKGTGMGCYIRALAAGKNDQERAAQIAKMWGREDVAQAISDSREKAMSAGDATAGGFLVPTEFSAEVIELLRATGTVRSLGPTVLPMSSGTIKIPKVTTGASGSYIGENTNISKSELDTGQLTLTFKKLAALVPVSNDLIRYAAPSADTIVRDDMVQAIASREDLAFIRDDGTSGKPKGLKNWIHSDNSFAAESTVSLANVTVDLGKAMQKLMDANINLVGEQGATGGLSVNPGWLMHPQQYRYLSTVQTGLGTYAFRDEMLRGTLWGYPFRVTTQVEDDTFYFAAFRHAVIGESLGITVDASQEAAYYDGSSVVAAFSQDQTVIRVLCEHDFALRHDKAAAVITSVTWGD